MAGAETRYTFRNRVPVTLERARASQVSAISAYHEGALAAITSGTYELIGDTGAVVVAEAAATITGGIAEFTLTDTELPATLGLSSRYQERWALEMPDGTTRTVRRRAALARFELHPPVDDTDIVRVYPDILDSLGNYATHLQGWIDDAWEEVVRKLWKHDNFPHIIVDAYDIYAWARELACARVFRALFRASDGVDERWKELWDYHEDKATAEQQGCRISVDRDEDGLADAEGLSAAAPARAHWNLPYTRNPGALSRKFR